MIYILAILCILLVGFAIALNILSLPGNWLAIVLLALWAWLAPDANIGLSYFLCIVLLAAFAEALEFYLQLRGAKKHGSSSFGSIAGLIGAFAGAILGAAFLFGLGALPGALLGAYVGALLAELLSGRTFTEARRSAWGAMTGKFSGIILKITVGLTILVTGAVRVWP